MKPSTTPSLEREDVTPAVAPPSRTRVHPSFCYCDHSGEMAATESVRNGRRHKLSYQGTGLFEALERFWQKSYAGDYLGLGLLVGALIVSHLLIPEPFHRMFRLDDARIQFPHAAQERVPPVWLFISSGAIPLVSLLVWALLFRPRVQKVHVTILGLVLTVILTLLLTDLLKNFVGRPRPDLISRCMPAAGTPTDSPVGIDVCTQSNQHVLQDGWRSWPSGHSSFSWSGLGYLALFLASQTHALKARASFALVLLCLLPLLGASYIAISRLEDYRHQVEDVVCGSLLGMGIAYFNWRRFYPSLLSETCDEPHEPRGSIRNASYAGFQMVRDEEGAGFSIGEDLEGRR